MKVILEILLVSYEERSDKGIKGEKHINLEKRIDLPFAPFIGLDIMLPCINNAHPDSKKFKKLLEASDELVESIVGVKKVTYDVEAQEFWVRVDIAYDCYDSPKAVESLAQQLIVGYGFEREEL